MRTRTREQAGAAAIMFSWLAGIATGVGVFVAVLHEFAWFVVCVILWAVCAVACSRASREANNGWEPPR